MLQFFKFPFHFALFTVFSCHRLHIQTANENLEYQKEIHDKYNMLRDQEIQAQIENLERLKIERELDRQKFVEHKQIQQHVWVTVLIVILWFDVKFNHFSNIENWLTHHRRNTEAFRFDMSKKLLEECKQSHDEQVQWLKLQQELAEAEENAFIQESRRKQLEEVR